VAVQFEKQSVHRSAEGLAFWRGWVFNECGKRCLNTRLKAQTKPRGFVPKNKLNYVRMVVLITLKA